MTDSQKRGGSSPEVNEPAPPYQVPGENPNKNRTERGSTEYDDPGSGGPPGNGQNEDDLPF